MTAHIACPGSCVRSCNPSLSFMQGNRGSKPMAEPDGFQNCECLKLGCCMSCSAAVKQNCIYACMHACPETLQTECITWHMAKLQGCRSQDLFLPEPEAAKVHELLGSCIGCEAIGLTSPQKHATRLAYLQSSKFADLT